MTETIIENLSGRKLAILVTFLIIGQITCILVGGLIAPIPGSVQHILGTLCKDNSMIENDTTAWYYYRGEGHCQSIDQEFIVEKNLSATDLVYVFQMPLPRENKILDFLRWQQSLTGVLKVDFAPGFHIQNYSEIESRTMISMDTRLAYRNKGDPDDEWKLYAQSKINRNMDCMSHTDISKCKTVPLFELSSLPHEYYLLNIRLPGNVSESSSNSYVRDIRLTVIVQNETFTAVWVSLKTVFFISFIATLCWFVKRICKLKPKRKLRLLEKLLFSLGISICLLNLPLEYLLLFFNMPLMLLLADIRQLVFYAKLFSFWLIFAGEHMIVRPDASLKKYWRHILVVVIGCILLFIFDIYERGVQLNKPFYSIWVTDLGLNINLASTFVILSRLLIGLYFLFLCYKVWKVFNSIDKKRLQYLPNMSTVRRLHYEGVVYRYQILMVVSMICAALTVIGIILGQVSEWKLDENVKLEPTSAFFTGVYGMWNFYILTLLVFYAPSRKRWGDDDNVNLHAQM